MAGCVAAGLLERGRGGSGFLPGSGGGGLGGADVLAGCLQGLGQRLGLGCGFAGAGPGGDGGGLGAAAGGLGLGDLGPDPRRVQAGGLLAGGPDEDGGLPDHALQRGERVGGAVRAPARRPGRGCGRRCGSGERIRGRRTAGCRPRSWAGSGFPQPGRLQTAAAAAGHLAIGGITGHDGTFRCRSCFSFHFSSDQK